MTSRLNGLSLGFTVSLFFCGCASNQDVQPSVNPQVQTVEDASYSSYTPMTSAWWEDTVAVDTTGERQSWVYYQHALEAIDNESWVLAEYCLEIALNRLHAERSIPWCREIDGSDGDYCERVSKLIVEAMGKVVAGNSAQESIDR